jgi:hypothetical protein
MNELNEYIDGLPNICGNETLIAETIAASNDKPAFLVDSDISFDSINSACACALHMQQPLIPAGGDDLHTAGLISNLKYMMDHPDIGDNHNASVFRWCYKRMGEFIPQLVNEGHSPRIMLDYSGVLLHGLRQMGLDDVLDDLKLITQDPAYRSKVEWLGCTWGHAVAPSTPIQDFRLHVRAWQHHFAAIFGLQALTRVRGFSPAEMALPNHPDVAYEFVKTLKDCGYQWVLVQEHSVELAESGYGLEARHLPHRLVCTNSQGETASIIAIIKTQGSDTKLVAQMQPWFEAQSLDRWELAGRSVPPLVSQIADGENGGVMMNEFPPKYMEVVRQASGSAVPLMNTTEYLEQLFALGVQAEDLVAVQPVHQHTLYQSFQSGDGPDKLEQAIKECHEQDHRFHMEGGSWTNNLSWVQGYEDVVGPMERASSHFNEKVLKAGVASNDPRYRNALFHLLASQTSCYRYWGQGLWTDYGKEICRRVEDILDNDF